jgi:hypothetical protein
MHQSNKSAHAGAPDPAFLRIHVAFARVLHIFGTAEYMDKLEMLVDGDIYFPCSR